MVFFKNLSLMEFQIRYLALLLLFWLIDGFEWFWIGNLHKNIQLMLQFLKGPFLVLHFSYYTLMTFLMMESVKLLSMLMILLSILSVNRGIWALATTWINFWTWIWSMKYCIPGQEVAWWFQCWENSNVFFLTGLITLVLLMDGSVLDEKWSFKMLGLTFSSKLD